MSGSTGIHIKSSSSRAIQRVRIARFKTEVNAMSKVNPCSLQRSSPACLASSLPLIGQINVSPAGEEVFLVPDALAMTQEDKLGHRSSCM